MVWASGAAKVSWASVRPGFAGFYWFKGSLAGKGKNREVMLATVVEVGTVGDRFVVWFPRGEGPIPVRECEGQWDGPLELPR
ncbi:MAG: hypothetical protein ABI980_14605 [Nitrospirota bacterium]